MMSGFWSYAMPIVLAALAGYLLGLGLSFLATIVYVAAALLQLRLLDADKGSRHVQP